MAEEIVPDPSVSIPVPSGSDLEGTTLISPAPQPKADPPRADKKFPVLLFFLLILLAVATAFSVYFFYQVRTMTLDKIVPSPIPSPIASPDPTADWQTYTNTQYQFVIKHPPEYQELQDKSGWPDALVLISRPNRQSYDLVIEKWSTEGSYKNKYPSELSKGTIVEYKRGDNKFITTFNVNNDSEVDQILSTFKFTDAKRSCTPTYTVESDTGGLTASQNYAQECLSKTTEESCLTVDIYNKQADNFSSPDKIPDCVWSD